LLAELFMMLEKVHYAQSKEEREALYRFRYKIYHGELKRKYGVDHDRKWVYDEDDESDYAHHFYVGNLDNIKGTVRLLIWNPGKIPKKFFDDLSLNRFPNINNYTVSEVGRFMIDKSSRGKSSRGKFILPAMARETYLFQARSKKVDIAFCFCRPGLVAYYQRLGMRSFGGRMVNTEEGMEIPMVSVLSDKAHYKKVRSPFTPLVKRAFGSNKRPVLDTSSFLHLFKMAAQNIVTNKVIVWEQISNAFINENYVEKAVFMDGLPETTLRYLAESGFIMDLAAQTLVTREGHVENELFIILSGSFEVTRNKKVLAVMGPREIFGEISFFKGDGGARTASVRCIEDGRIITLRRKFLDNLVEKDPKAAHHLLMNLARVLAERFN
jgi:CRP-like cAMP-binding protein/N-acyl-L-homoserine lactone synthetase